MNHFPRLHRSANALRFSSASVLLFGAIAASEPACSADSRPPSLINLGAALPSEGGRTGSASPEAGSANDSGTSGDAQNAGAGGEGGSAGAADEFHGIAGERSAVPAECARLPAWSGATRVSGVSTEANETLLAMTPDELDLAFLRDGALFVAHRPSTSASFSSGTPVTIPVGFSAAQGAALSADGLRLLLVSDPDQKKLGELTRASRESGFSTTIDTSAFAAINQESNFTRRVYAWPSISLGDDQLIFSSSLDAASTVVVSSRTESGVFSAPRSFGSGLLDGSDGKRRLPTGVSADGRTLFYFNEESGEEEARWRENNRSESPLYDMLSLGARRNAVPNAGCTRLYSTDNGDVVVEKA